MIQYIAVAICLIIAAGYAAWRIRKALQKQHDPCCGCNGCDLKNTVCEKKNKEKFGQSK